jgi:hypothetical protein
MAVGEQLFFLMLSYSGEFLMPLAEALQAETTTTFFIVVDSIELSYQEGLQQHYKLQRNS